MKVSVDGRRGTGVKKGDLVKFLFHGSEERSFE